MHSHDYFKLFDFGSNSLASFFPSSRSRQFVPSARSHPAKCPQRRRHVAASRCTARARLPPESMLFAGHQAIQVQKRREERCCRGAKDQVLQTGYSLLLSCVPLRSSCRPQRCPPSFAAAEFSRSASPGVRPPFLLLSTESEPRACQELLRCSTPVCRDGGARYESASSRFQRLIDRKVTQRFCWLQAPLRNATSSFTPTKSRRTPARAQTQPKHRPTKKKRKRRSQKKYGEL
jgi:hypothetical protein